MLGLLRRRGGAAPGVRAEDDCRELLDAICPEKGEARKHWYEEPYRKLSLWLGSHPMIVSGKPIRRIRWQRELGLEGMQILDDLSTRNWAVIRGEDRWHWHRIVYLRGLVWRLATLLHDYEIELDRTEPPQELIRRRAPWIIDAGGLENGLLVAAGVALGPRDVNEAVWYAWLDSFGAEPRPDNPVRIALEGAWRKLCDRYRAQPGEEPVRLMEWPAGVVQVADSDTGAPGERRGVAVGHGDGVSDAAVSIPDGGGAPAREAPPERDVQGEAARSLLALLAKGLQEGRIYANCSGATVHGLKEQVGLVVPLAWEWLGAGTQQEPEKIGAILKRRQAELAEGSWGFRTRDRKGRERFRPIHLQLFRRTELPGVLAKVPVNPDLARREEKG